MNTEAKNRQHVAQLASHVPGRIRIKLHHNSRRLHIIRQIEESLTLQEGIQDVKTNEATGSIRINYDTTRHDMPGIRKVLEDLDVIVSDYAGTAMPDGEAIAAAGEKNSMTFVSAVEDLNEWLSTVTGVRMDLKIILPVGFLGAGIWSILRNGLMTAKIPGWLFLWLAFDTFVKLHPPNTAPSSSVPCTADFVETTR
jgi:Heavy metal associated domain 2